MFSMPSFWEYGGQGICLCSLIKMSNVIFLLDYIHFIVYIVGANKLRLLGAIGYHLLLMFVSILIYLVSKKMENCMKIKL